MFGGGGGESWTFKSIIFAMTIMLLLPTMLVVFCPGQAVDVDRDELFDGYYQMTGQQADTKTSVWALTGIYTPYSGGAYGYTEDGWLYGTEVKSYTPTQYRSTQEQYTVYKADDGVFRYYSPSRDYNATTGTGHNTGDLYTNVSFDVNQKSSIFFSEGLRNDTDKGFYYEYEGYRLAFQPIASYTVYDENGDRVPVIATTTSLSLIWYQYYTQSGVSGQLVLSGSSGGVSYLNGAQIVGAFNSNTSTASFNMIFNGGIKMDIHIRIDPFYLANGYTVQECYDLGYWSIMVTSQSADASAYTGTDYALSVTNIWNAIVSLFTFNYDDYNIDGTAGVLCSVLFVLPLYAILITLAISHVEIWLVVAVIAFINGVSAFSLFG